MGFKLWAIGVSALAVLIIFNVPSFSCTSQAQPLPNIDVATDLN